MTIDRKTGPLRALFFTGIIAAVWPLLAADWPQWRGPQRDGVAEAEATPATWPETLKKSWSVPVGEGHASPVVRGDRVWVHAREGEREVVTARKLADGSVLWSQQWDVAYEMHPAAAGHGKGPKSTPVLHDGTLYTLGIQGVLTALDAATGTVRWKHEMSSRFKATSPKFGVAASPAVDRNLVFAPFGGHHDGTLAALDVKTGAPRWSLDGDGPGYASPVVAELAGIRQVITQTDQRIVGVAVQDGRLLWSLPLSTPYDQNAVTPLVLADRLIVSGLEHGLRAYTFERSGDRITPRETWNRPEASLYMSSPVTVAGRLFGFSHRKRGQLVCVDPKSGDMVWSGPDSLGDNAALVAAGNAVLALTDGAELIVMKADAPAFTQLARYKVADSPTWAHPVPAGGGVLVKDKTHLILWTW
jgi:outer membrane protein assembly factor BamB